MSRYKTDEYREKHAEHARGWREANRLRNNERVRLWAKANPEKVKAAQRRHGLKKLYGLTPEAHARMLESQGGRCAICKSTDSGRRGGSWATDHDHVTGKLRSILCHRCNSMLGYARDNAAILRAAIRYLDQHADIPPAAKTQRGLFEVA